MDVTDCDYDKVLVPFKSGGGGQAIKEFEKYLDKDGERINEEHKRDVQQRGVYDEVDILDPENMDNSEIASWQWCHDNPDWWEEL